MQGLQCGAELPDVGRFPRESPDQWTGYMVLDSMSAEPSEGCLLPAEPSVPSRGPSVAHRRSNGNSRPGLRGGGGSARSALDSFRRHWGHSFSALGLCLVCEHKQVWLPGLWSPHLRSGTWSQWSAPSV